MGNPLLWSLLREKGLLQTYEGYDACKRIEGKTLAIDVSIWIFEAILNKETALYYREWAHLKVIFDRLIHFLRAGVLPVLVLDGKRPFAKLHQIWKRNGYAFDEERIRAQSEAQPNSPMYKSNAHSLEIDVSNSTWEMYKIQVKALSEAMGIPCLRADFEAESLCAKLNALGYVDGVVSNDFDSFLFGAKEVYKTLKLSTTRISSSLVEVCSISSIQDVLDLDKIDLIGANLLIGNDYDSNGASDVGPSIALRVIAEVKSQMKAQGIYTPDAKLKILEEIIFQRRVDPNSDLITKPIATCKRCCHGSVSKVSHGKQGCLNCGTHSKGQGGDGFGGCIENKGRFEELKGKRLLAQVALKAQNTMDYRRKWDTAKRLFMQETRIPEFDDFIDNGKGITEGDVDRTIDLTEEIDCCKYNPNPDTKLRFKWVHRPSIEKIIEAIPVSTKNPKFIQNLVKKLLPLFLEWDIRRMKTHLGLNLIRLGSEWDGKYSDSIIHKAREPLNDFFFLPVAILRPSKIGVSQTTASKSGTRKPNDFETPIDNNKRGSKVPGSFQILDSERMLGLEEFGDEMDQDTLDELNSATNNPNPTGPSSNSNPWRYIVQWTCIYTDFVTDFNITTQQLDENEKIRQFGDKYILDNMMNAEGKSVRANVIKENCPNFLSTYSKAANQRKKTPSTFTPKNQRRLEFYFSSPVTPKSRPQAPELNFETITVTNSNCEVAESIMIDLTSEETAIFPPKSPQFVHRSLSLLNSNFNSNSGPQTPRSSVKRKSKTPQAPKKNKINPSAKPNPNIRPKNLQKYYFNRDEI